jgi:hypothetical protein
MITCHRKFLEARCIERGYTLDEVMPCVISQNGDEWTIDINHPQYPSNPKIKINKKLSGPGTELKKILSYIGITATPTCSCNDRARRMDEMEAKEPGWCTKNMDTIITWLREESEKRGLPFIEIVARGMVNLAIKRAKKNIK